MINLLRSLHFHKWIYREGKIQNIEDNSVYETQYRTCQKCGKEEVFINEGPVSGMADYSYWKNIKKLSQKSEPSCTG